MNLFLKKRRNNGEARTRELVEANLFLDAIIENIPNMIFVKDAEELRFVRFNKAGEDLLGYPREDLIGKNDYDLFPSEEADFFTEKDRNVLKGGELVDIPEEPIHTREKGKRILHTKKIPLNLDGDGTKYLLGISEDITELKAAEKALRDSEERLQAFTSVFPDLAFIIDVTGTYVDILATDESRLYTDAKHLIGKKMRDVFDKATADRFLEVVLKTAETGKSQLLEYQLDVPAGKCWFEGRTAKMPTVAGEAEAVLFVARDITDRRRAEEERAKLQRREVQLQEIHHRVKNNLQVITSLLNLQARNTKDDVSRKVLEDIRLRVQSMALIHEQLHDTGRENTIDFGQYLTDLVARLKRSIISESQSIDVSLDVESVALDIDVAVPCGLLVNELITNAMEHAFPDDRSGTIVIQFKTTSPEHYELIVEDDGIGLPQGLDPKNTDSIGLQLINTLARQLKCKVDVSVNKGTRFRVSCNLEDETGA